MRHNMKKQDPNMDTGLNERNAGNNSMKRGTMDKSDQTNTIRENYVSPKRREKPEIKPKPKFGPTSDVRSFQEVISELNQTFEMKDSSPGHKPPQMRDKIRSKSVGQGMNLITDLKPERMHYTLQRDNVPKNDLEISGSDSDGEEEINYDTFEPALNFDNGQRISIAVLKNGDISEGWYEIIGDVKPQTLENLKQAAQDSTGCSSDSTETVVEVSSEEKCAKDVKAARKKKFKKAMKFLKIGGRVILIISKVALSAAGVGTEIVDAVEGAVEITETTMDIVDTTSDAIDTTKDIVNIGQSALKEGNKKKKVEKQNSKKMQSGKFAKSGMQALSAGDKFGIRNKIGIEGMTDKITDPGDLIENSS